jgi:release factor glutamine methyltransferase
MKIHDLLEITIARLEPLSETSQLDAQVLISHIIQKGRTWVVAHPEYNVGEEKQDQLNHALIKLETGEPLPYVLGKWEFFGLEFDITKDVLIPRPETELLVEKAIAWLQASPERRTIADVGTGSGVIATSIAMQVPDAYILATDISLDALRIAQHNARKFHVHHLIDFLQCDLLPQHIDNLSTDRHFDLICANLPYIPTKTLHKLPIFGREPTLALDGGTDGLDIYRRLFKLAPNWLAPQGMMLLETEATLGVQVLSLAYDSFSDVTIHLHQDLAGHDRLVEIQFHEQQA